MIEHLVRVVVYALQILLLILKSQMFVSLYDSIKNKSIHLYKKMAIFYFSRLIINYPYINRTDVIFILYGQLFLALILLYWLLTFIIKPIHDYLIASVPLVNFKCMSYMLKIMTSKFYPFSKLFHVFIMNNTNMSIKR